MTYYEQLKDPRWQKRRLEILNRDKFTCQFCASNDQELHVHHRCYHKNQMVWDYEDYELLTLCHECHALAGRFTKQLKTACSQLPIELEWDLAIVLDRVVHLVSEGEQPKDALADQLSLWVESLRRTPEQVAAWLKLERLWYDVPLQAVTAAKDEDATEVS